MYKSLITTRTPSLSCHSTYDLCNGARARGRVGEVETGQGAAHDCVLGNLGEIRERQLVVLHLFPAAHGNNKFFALAYASSSSALYTQKYDWVRRKEDCSLFSRKFMPS